MPKAIADTDGFYNNQYVRKGERFDVDDKTAQTADEIAKDVDANGKPKKYTWIRLVANQPAEPAPAPAVAPERDPNLDPELYSDEPEPSRGGKRKR